MCASGGRGAAVPVRAASSICAAPCAATFVTAASFSTGPSASRNRNRARSSSSPTSAARWRYTRLLLLFTYGLAKALEQKVEAFVFSTRLTRITRQLQQRNLDHALREVSRVVPDWSGGTRIGDALHTFNFKWSRRVLGRGAITVVISDGWDCGDIDLLREEIARLQRSSRRLIWLIPLLGSPDYQPLTRGIQAALHYIDDFLPVHNLDSLEALAKHLGTLDEHRPARRQAVHAERTL